MASPKPSELYFACRNGDIDTVKLLLPKTPLEILNRLEPNGSTCLHAASFHGHKEIVCLLLSHGASRRIINTYGCTAADEAKTDEISDLFPRRTTAAKQRFSQNPSTQTEWQFAEDNAESFSRAFHWNCIKDRGVKKTLKKIRDAGILDETATDEENLRLQSLLKQAAQENDPVYMLIAYTVETPFYYELNKFMSSGNRRQVFERIQKKWSGYYTGLIMKNRAFDQFRYSGQTYRGMELTPNDFSQYQIGRALTNKSFQSTSKSWKVAKRFACPKEPRLGRLPVIIFFNIKDKQSAVDIEQISEYPDEEEVLIMPGTLFIVVSVNQNENPYEVYVEQIEWKDEF